MRIAVVGTSGAGKSTLSRRIAAVLAIPHVELDALHWRPGWTEAPPTELHAHVADAVARDAWVVDGNYVQVRDLVWPRANVVLWLDPPFLVVLWRIVTRTLRRTLTGQELWNGNRERFRTSFLSRDSVVLWAITTFRTRRETYAHLHASTPKLVRLRTNREVDAWLHTVALTPPRTP